MNTYICNPLNLCRENILCERHSVKMYVKCPEGYKSNEK